MPRRLPAVVDELSQLLRPAAAPQSAKSAPSMNRDSLRLCAEMAMALSSADRVRELLLLLCVCVISLAVWPCVSHRG